MVSLICQKLTFWRTAQWLRLDRALGGVREVVVMVRVNVSFQEMDAILCNVPKSDLCKRCVCVYVLVPGLS